MIGLVFPERSWSGFNVVHCWFSRNQEWIYPIMRFLPSICRNRAQKAKPTELQSCVLFLVGFCASKLPKVGSVLRTRYRYTYPFLFTTPNSAPSPHTLCLYPLSNQYSTHPSSHNAKPNLANPRFLLFLPFNGAHRALRRGLGAVPNIIGREKPRQERSLF